MVAAGRARREPPTAWDAMPTGTIVERAAYIEACARALTAPAPSSVPTFASATAPPRLPDHAARHDLPPAVRTPFEARALGTERCYFCADAHTEPRLVNPYASRNTVAMCASCLGPLAGAGEPC